MQIVNHNKIALGVKSVINNAEKFLNAAKIIFKINPRISYLLILYSFEEMGKVPLIMNLLFYTDTKAKWRKWQERFKDHEEKFQFSEDIDDFMKNKIPNHNHEINHALIKQEISYVAFVGNEFKAPKQISQKELKTEYQKARNRLQYLKKRHSKLESIKRELKGLEKQKGLSYEDWKKLYKQK